MKKFDIPQLEGIFSEPWSWKKLVGLMGVFGPAAIVASVAIGAGETIVVVRAGAWAGYDLLWVVLLSCLVKGIFVTYMIGRYTAVSGELIGNRMVKFPGPRGWLLFIIILMEFFAAPMGWVAIAKPCGDLFHYILPFPNTFSEPVWENIISSFFIALALGLSIRLSYEKLEKQQLLICGILVSGTVIGTLMVRPDFLKALVGMFNFGYIPEFPSWAPDDAVKHRMLTIATTFGYVGGSVMAYVVYANWVGMHKWGLNYHKDIDAIRSHALTRERIDYLPEDPESVDRLRRLCSPLHWDVSMGALVLFIVTVAFMLSGAVVLMPLHSRFEGWSLLTNQAHVWATIHPTLVWIYYVCVIAALWGTLQALPEIYSRVTHEFFESIWPQRTWSILKVKRVICLYIFLVTMVLVWSNVPFNTLIQIVGFLSVNFATALVMVVALFLNFKLPAVYRTKAPILIGSVMSSVILIIFAVTSGFGLARKLIGF
jgi:Mn2+/Fe2+ NRAMP family transporter